MSWHAVDAEGRDLSTGRPPQPSPGGHRSPAAAVAAARTIRWPLAVVADDGGQIDLAGALGPGGAVAARLLGRIATGARLGPDADIPALARTTPLGVVDLPVVVVPAGEALDESLALPAGWLHALEFRRQQAWRALTCGGRRVELEAVLNVAVLLLADRTSADDPPDERMASGARMWLLGPALASALANQVHDPFAAWGELVAHGLLPVGPLGGRLVVADRAA